MTLLVCFQRVCPSHVHFLLAIAFLMLFGQLLINVSSIRVVVMVTLHVSEPYSSTFHISVEDSDLVSC